VDELLDVHPENLLRAKLQLGLLGCRHRGLAITPAERHRFVSLISLAADDAGLPNDPEFRSALIAYAEWGSRLAMHNSQPGAEVAEHAPVPRWGWGEAPPFEPENDLRS
jgi:hemoglobin